MHTSHLSSDPNSDTNFLSRKIKLFTWIIFICWTILIASSWFWNFQAEQNVLKKVAMAEANTVIERDALYRRWASSHGGVYVPTTVHTPPNPYLSHIDERDIVTASGKHLTLMNPAYMTREVNELDNTDNLFLGKAHITSLKPLRPENSPDTWEANALRSFEKGAREVSEVVNIHGKPYMRVIRAFITDKPCMKCHAIQGYTVGSVRGGIAVSIPLQPLIDAARMQVIGFGIFHALVWILGLLAIGFGARHLFLTALAQKQVESELHRQTVRLEEEIAERQQFQEALEQERARLQIVADYASNWEFWRLPDDSFMYISPSVHELTGYSVLEFNENPALLFNVIHPEDRELFRHHTHKFGPTGQILPIEMRIVHKSGEVRWISHVCQQVFTKGGLPWGWRASNEDITTRKAMETELLHQAEELEEEVAERQATQEELEDLNRSLEKRIDVAVGDLRKKDQTLIQQGRLAAMGEMINNIAHQWRQPLNNVGLIIQNLQYSYKDGTLSAAEMTSEVEKAMDVILHMSHTIDDFRNFFREDKQKTGFFVGKAVHEALEFVSAALSSQNIQVEFKNDPSITAIGYKNEYAQVLLNILSNTRETCSERCMDSAFINIHVTSENGRSVVYLSDNCGGIAEDVMPRIFDPYYTTRAPDKGTGIGLYMSKVIIEQNMGGSLTASNKGEGVEFRIEV